MFKGTLTIRPAVCDPSEDFDSPKNADIRNICSLLGGYAEEKLLLPRTHEDVEEKIANFRIAELDGKFIGCVALRHYGNSLYEVRSFAVEKPFVGQGIGSKMLEGIIEQFRKKGEKAQLFSLTYRTHFFTRLGFHVVDKSMFPGKIWSDCVICAKKDHCDETAVLMEF